MTFQSKAQHTPGPWNSLRGSSGGYDIISSDNSPVDVCVISKRDKDKAGIDANITLIAAAPELLDALQALHKFTVVGTDAERHAALHKAWAAITKATGAA